MRWWFLDSFYYVKICRAPFDACRKSAIKLFIIIIIIIINTILACDGFHKFISIAAAVDYRVSAASTQN